MDTTAMFLLLADSSAFNAGRELAEADHGRFCLCNDCAPFEMDDEALYVPMSRRCLGCGYPMLSDVFTRCAACELERLKEEDVR